MQKRILILGAEGYIGSALWAYFHSLQKNPMGTARQPKQGLAVFQGDLKHLESFVSKSSSFSHVLIAFGKTKLMECEQFPKETSQINVKNTVEIAKFFHSLGVIPIVFSTDYVFDGVKGNYQEEDVTNPLNEYGRQKVALESLIQQTCPNALILRLSKVYSLEGIGGKTLIDEMHTRLVEGRCVQAAQDQIMTPIYLEDVCKAINGLIEHKATGLFHLSSCTPISRYELACQVAKRYGGTHLIRKILLKNLNEPFARPEKTDMCCQKLTQSVKFTPRSVHTIFQ